MSGGKDDEPTFVTKNRHVPVTDAEPELGWDPATALAASVLDDEKDVVLGKTTPVPADAKLVGFRPMLFV